MSADEGFVLIRRKIRHNCFWKSEKFSKGQALVDLILRASYEDRNFLFGGEMMFCHRGEFITSMVKLADEWQWSRTKVKKFLDMLVSEGTISYHADKRKTVIRLLNYDIYQNPKSAKKQLTGQQKCNRNTSENQVKSTIKEINEVNELKEKESDSAERGKIGYTNF